MTMKWEETRFKSPMARAKGLGSSRGGLHHWLMQKITALVNIPLVIWMVWSLPILAQADYAAASAWLSQPVNAVLMIAFVISAFYHAALGLQVVIEDYVHCEVAKLASLIAVKAGLLLLGLMAVFSVLRVAL
jgi:succinate dehydrogenase / fumarate reductase membrane anchor subunit